MNEGKVLEVTDFKAGDALEIKVKCEVLETNLTSTRICQIRVRLPNGSDLGTVWVEEEMLAENTTDKSIYEKYLKNKLANIELEKENIESKINGLTK